jgi:pyridoxamine 5'-phosphate oxidase
MPQPSASEDPFSRFAALYARAEATGMDDFNAMVVASADGEGRPSTRVVLLKAFDPRGFVFYTNLESRKGRQIREQPRVSLNFFWRELGEQVTVEGRAEQVTDAEADAYFANRPRASQLGAWASRQSQPLESRARLLADVARLEARFLGRAVPRPPCWSGFRVVPDYFEFWVEGLFRLHDRTSYRRTGDGWAVSKLYP